MLFADYVRMLRREWPAWRDKADAEERKALETRVDVNEWYPMETFERLGLRILREIVGTETDSIRLWGRGQVQTILSFLPDLATNDDPRESVMRFSNFLASLFDFPAVRVEGVDDEDAMLIIDYGMTQLAEQAAAWQTVGFFEELVTASGGRGVRSSLESARWIGAPQTRVHLTWSSKRNMSPRPFFERPRVLLVDDEVLVARALIRMLSKVAELTVASGAAEAVRLLETREFDTVLSDYSMPDRDGLSLLEEVSRRWPQIKRVLHSANAPARASDMMKRGVLHEVIDKPASQDVLVAALTSRAAS
ncbi:MAG: response regulator [Archangium sp.]|nr:response regulator [Archangium sp.]